MFDASLGWKGSQSNPYLAPSLSDLSISPAPASAPSYAPVSAPAPSIQRAFPFTSHFDKNFQSPHEAPSALSHLPASPHSPFVHTSPCSSVSAPSNAASLVSSSSSPSLCSPAAVEIVQHLNYGRSDAAFQKARANALVDGDCAGLLALCYYYGFGTNISMEEKDRWSSIAIEKGTTLGCAIGYYCIQKYEMSAPLLRPLVIEGVSVAQCMLGFQLENSFGVQKNVKESVSLYRKSADQGYPIALNNLGVCYEKGVGVEKDDHKALYFYQQSAAKGCAMAECNLGLAYSYGKLGLKKDKAEAWKYFERSAAKGNKKATRILWVKGKALCIEGAGADTGA